MIPTSLLLILAGLSLAVFAIGAALVLIVRAVLRIEAMLMEGDA